MMQDVMVDLETLGSTPGCALLSIGAVAFDPTTGEIDDGLYTVVSINSCVVAGLRFDQDTLDWWKMQSPAAREVLKHAYSDEAPSLRQALNSLDIYLAKHGGRRSARVWGNGADFDNPILVSAYKALGLGAPWSFWNSRCYRTLKNLHPEVELSRTGTHHNALDDARSQALHALAIFAARRPVAKPPVRVQEDDLIG